MFILLWNDNEYTTEGNFQNLKCLCTKEFLQSSYVLIKWLNYKARTGLFLISVLLMLIISIISPTCSEWHNSFQHSSNARICLQWFFSVYDEPISWPAEFLLCSNGNDVWISRSAESVSIHNAPYDQSATAVKLQAWQTTEYYSNSAHRHSSPSGHESLQPNKWNLPELWFCRKCSKPTEQPLQFDQPASTNTSFIWCTSCHEWSVKQGAVVNDFQLCSSFFS